MLQLYKNIRKYRKALKMSQQELAERTGYSDRSSIAKIETGLVDLPQSKILLFAYALNVTPSELMGDVDDVQTSGQEQSYYLDTETREMLKFLDQNPEYKALLSSSRKLKPEDLEIIKSMIERFSE